MALQPQDAAVKSSRDSVAALRDLERLADPQAAKFLQRYFRTGPGEYGAGDRFLGIRVPQLRKLARTWRALPLDHCVELLRSPWHEARLLALLLLVERYRRGTPIEREWINRIYLDHTRHINNWDLVDVSAPQLLGAHLHPDALGTLEGLVRSTCVWERRIAMLATFHWIKQGVFDPALRLATLLRHDPHDLIHKAVGWMLREIGKRDEAVEEAFLREHYRSLPRTLLRYAVERFPERRRQAYLKGRV